MENMISDGRVFVNKQPESTSIIGSQGLHRVNVYEPDARIIERDPLVDDVFIAIDMMRSLFLRAGEMIGVFSRN